MILPGIVVSVKTCRKCLSLQAKKKIKAAASVKEKADD